jgi:Oxygenase domain of the 2OGFeDO superfamily
MAVIGSILALIHPALFESGLDVLSNLHSGNIHCPRQDLLREVLTVWASPFTAFSVINNRETPVHRDFCSPQFGYDLLYTGGFYEGGRLEIRGLGVRCRYEPGTIVALPSAVFPHGVAPVRGPRVCITQYMRSDILSRNPFYRAPNLPTSDLLHNLYRNLYTVVQKV